ncbi:MAG: putative bifunctional diguanylate cyclase/phosphodiesterase [Acidimicrobiia bacterium]
MSEAGDQGELHPTLARDLRRLRLDASSVPSPEQWATLLQRVSTAYRNADNDRYLYERSVEVSSDEMRELYDSLRRQAREDPLTGLPNRAEVVERLRIETTRAERTNHPIVVLYIDLDRFKLVNDSLGHAAGDELIKLAASRIRSAVRGSDVVARLGGDEFVVVSSGFRDARDATMLGQRILELLESPFDIAGQRAFVGASVGIADARPGELSADDLLQRADVAMYRAKSLGAGRCVHFDGDMQAEAEQRLSTEVALRSAIANDELEVRYQPIVSLIDGHLIGAESLVRWDRPGYGVLPPSEFIAIAEQSTLVCQIDRWVLGESARQVAKWRAGLAPFMKVSVNLSARGAQESDLVANVMGAVGDANLDFRALTVELTESSLLSAQVQILDNLTGLRALGVGIALDDFGTGYSSLAYLKRLPANILKIDKSFVDGVDQDESSASIVGAVIDMGHALGLSIVVEGVERQSQADKLSSLGVEAAQGYLFSPPVPAAVFEEQWLVAREPAVRRLAG